MCTAAKWQSSTAKAPSQQCFVEKGCLPCCMVRPIPVSHSRLQCVTGSMLCMVYPFGLLPFGHQLQA